MRSPPSPSRDIFSTSITTHRLKKMQRSSPSPSPSFSSVSQSHLPTPDSASAPSPSLSPSSMRAYSHPHHFDDNGYQQRPRQSQPYQHQYGQHYHQEESYHSLQHSSPNVHQGHHTHPHSDFYQANSNANVNSVHASASAWASRYHPAFPPRQHSPSATMADHHRAYLESPSSATSAPFLHPIGDHAHQHHHQQTETANDMTGTDHFRRRSSPYEESSQQNLTSRSLPLPTPTLGHSSGTVGGPRRRSLKPVFQPYQLSSPKNRHSVHGGVLASSAGASNHHLSGALDTGSPESVVSRSSSSSPPHHYHRRHHHHQPPPPQQQSQQHQRHQPDPHRLDHYSLEAIRPQTQTQTVMAGQAPDSASASPTRPQTGSATQSGSPTSRVFQKAYGADHEAQVQDIFHHMQLADNRTVDTRSIGFSANLIISRWEPSTAPSADDVVSVAHSSSVATCPLSKTQTNTVTANAGPPSTTPAVKASPSDALRFMSLANYIRHLIVLTSTVPAPAPVAKSLLANDNNNALPDAAHSSSPLSIDTSSALTATTKVQASTTAHQHLQQTNGTPLNTLSVQTPPSASISPDVLSTAANADDNNNNNSKSRNLINVDSTLPPVIDSLTAATSTPTSLTSSSPSTTALGTPANLSKDFVGPVKVTLSASAKHQRQVANNHSTYHSSRVRKTFRQQQQKVMMLLKQEKEDEKKLQLPTTFPLRPSYQHLQSVSSIASAAGIVTSGAVNRANMIQVPYPNVTLTLALVYINRLKTRYPETKGESGCSHRLFLVAYIIAAKYRYSVELCRRRALAAVDNQSTIEDAHQSAVGNLVFSNQAWVQLLNFGNFHVLPSPSSQQQQQQQHHQSMVPRVGSNGLPIHSSTPMPMPMPMMSTGVGGSVSLKVEDLTRMELEFLTFLNCDLSTPGPDLKSCWDILTGKGVNTTATSSSSSSSSSSAPVEAAAEAAVAATVTATVAPSAN